MALFTFSETYSGEQIVVEAHDKSADHVRISIHVPSGELRLNPIELRIGDLRGTPRIEAQVGVPSRGWSAHDHPDARFKDVEFVDVDFGRVVVERSRANSHPNAVIDVVRVDFVLFATKERERGSSSVRYAGRIECRVL